MSKTAWGRIDFKKGKSSFYEKPLYTLFKYTTYLLCHYTIPLGEHKIGKVRIQGGRLPLQAYTENQFHPHPLVTWIRKCILTWTNNIDLHLKRMIHVTLTEHSSSLDKYTYVPPHERCASVHSSPPLDLWRFTRSWASLSVGSAERPNISNKDWNEENP